MKQIVPKPIPGLVAVAQMTANGAALYEGDVGLLHNTAGKIQTEIDAVGTSVYHYEEGRNTLRDAYDRLAQKIEVVRAIATITREILKLKLGKKFCEAWIATGFTRSLAIPRSATELLPLILILGRFLGENPGLEVPALNVTAAYLATLYQELLAAVDSVNENTAIVDDLLAIRNEKVARLRKRVRDLVAELHQLIEPTDSRWVAFGLNTPGIEETPEVPEEIEAIVVNDTAAMLSFPRPARAAYYRVYQRVLGVDAEPVYVGSPSDPNFTSQTLPRHSTVEFYLQAINSGGESALTPPVVVKIE